MQFITTYAKELKSYRTNTDEIKLDFINALPKELALKILSSSNLSGLGINCLISKEWKLLSSNPILWKTAIHRELSFHNGKWAQAFDENIVKDEDPEEEFSSLPSNIVEYYQDFQRKFPEKQAKDSLMLVRLPKTLNGELTLNSFKDLVKKYFPKNNNGYRVFWDAIANQLGNKPIEESYWVLMTTDIIPESENKDYDEQQELIKNKLPGYEIPGTLEAVVCILSQYFASNTRLFKDNPWSFTRCSDTVQGSQTLVGGFATTGPRIQILINNTSGVAALCKFPPLVPGPYPQV